MFLLMFEHYDYGDGYSEIIGIYDSYEKVDAAGALYISKALEEFYHDFKWNLENQAPILTSPVWNTPEKVQTLLVENCITNVRRLTNGLSIIPLDVNRPDFNEFWEGKQ